MRKLCFVICVLLLLPLPAAAQHSFSLPSIGLPLPAIGLPPQKTPWWEERRVPDWERNHRTPPWERGHVPRGVVDVGHQRPVGGHQRGVIGPQVVYYYVPYPVTVVEQAPPQVIVVQQPPVHITVEAPPREPREQPAPREPEPPFVPSGDRTVYVIPGCYVGNVSPANLKLPPSCDVKKVTTFNP